MVQTTTNETITENDVVQTTTNENTEEDKTSTDNVTSFNLDVSDNPYILTPPPITSPPKLLNYHLLSSGITPEKLEDITCDLILDLMPTMTSECLNQLLRKTYVKLTSK